MSLLTCYGCVMAKNVALTNNKPLIHVMQKALCLQTILLFQFTETPAHTVDPSKGNSDWRTDACKLPTPPLGYGNTASWLADGQEARAAAAVGAALQM